MELYLAALGNVEGTIKINDISYKLSASSDPIFVDKKDEIAKITICPKNGKFGDSEDNFLFVYTQVDPRAQNFELSGEFRIHIDEEAEPERQAGYGVFAVDTVSCRQDSCRYRNQISIGRYRMDSPFTTGSGMRVIAGYRNPNAVEFGSVRRIDTNRIAVQTKFDNHIRNNESGRFSLTKTNEGFFGSIKTENTTESFSIPGCDTLMVQDPDHINIGFAAAGKMELIVKNTIFVTVY